MHHHLGHPTACVKADPDGLPSAISRFRHQLAENARHTRLTDEDRVEIEDLLKTIARLLGDT